MSFLFSTNHIETNLDFLKCINFLYLTHNTYNINKFLFRKDFNIFFLVTITSPTILNLKFSLYAKGNIMIKTYIKHYFIMALLICFTFHSISASPISTSQVDRTMNESLNSLTNIERQLKSIVKTIYLNEPDNTSNENLLKQLNVFSDQIKNIQGTLDQISPSELDTQQNDTLRYLLTITRFLDYIELKTSALASTSDKFERYDLLNSILLTNYLVNAIISNTN